MIAWQIHIDCCFSFFHVICSRIAVCNKFIFIDVDCEDVKNRTKQRMLLMIIVTNSLSVIVTNKSLKQKRNETKRNSNFLFEILSDCLLIWWFDVKLLLCVIFFFQQNDVSTFKQKNNDCKNHFDVNKQIDSKNHENHLLTKCRLISTNKKIDYWFVDEIFIFHHDKLIDFRNKKINNWLSFSQIHDHFRWFTMRIMKVKCNHCFQKKKFKLTIFFWFAYFYKWFDDFLLNIRVFLRTMKILFWLVFSTNNWRFFLITRVFLRAYLTILFCLLCRNQNVDEIVSKRKLRD